MNDIQFDEVTHTYTRYGSQYTSVTTLLKKYNLSANYAGIPDTVMQKAAARGHSVHKALEDYIKTNVITPNVPELEAFIKYASLRNLDLTKAISEEVTYNDIYKIAGTIDLQYYDGNDYIIADFKTTSSVHWNSVAWQLSIYNFLKCNGDIIQYYLAKLKVIHLQGTKLAVKDIPIIEYDEVLKLLQANLNGDPYTYVPDLTKIISNSEGIVFAQLMNEIEQYTTILAELEAKKKVFVEKITTNMKANSQHTFNIDNIKVTYSDPTSRSSLDKKKVEDYCKVNGIDIKTFMTTSTVKEKLSITVQKGKP